MTAYTELENNLEALKLNAIREYYQITSKETNNSR